MTFGTRPRWKQPPFKTHSKPKGKKSRDRQTARRRRAWAWTGRGLSPLSHAGCDAATPIPPELRSCWPPISALKLCYGQPVRPVFALLWLVLAVGGKRVRPKTALEHLQGTVLLWLLFFSFLLPAHFFRWRLLWTNECGLEKRGKRSFCGWPLPLHR